MFPLWVGRAQTVGPGTRNLIVGLQNRFLFLCRSRVGGVPTAYCPLTTASPGALPKAQLPMHSY